MNTALLFALMTVLCWGMYGVALHSGSMKMQAETPEIGRYKAFLWVGLMYFLVAVLAPIIILVAKGASWKMPAPGIAWSSAAGMFGAIGALGVLLAFGAGGKPPVVMSIIFAGAPVVNSIVALSMHPPAGGWSAIKWPFYLGILMAATGGYLVVKFKPGDPPKKPEAPATAEHAAPADS